MIKTISKIGNSRGIILDSAILQLAKLKEGDQVNLEVHAGGSITITPMKPRHSKEEVTSLISETINEYSSTLEELAK